MSSESLNAGIEYIIVINLKHHCNLVLHVFVYNIQSKIFGELLC